MFLHELFHLMYFQAKLHVKHIYTNIFLEIHIFVLCCEILPENTQYSSQVNISKANIYKQNVRFVSWKIERFLFIRFSYFLLWMFTNMSWENLNIDIDYLYLYSKFEMNTKESVWHIFVLYIYIALAIWYTLYCTTKWKIRQIKLYT